MLLYSTMLGVKIVNINNGKVVRTIGKQENLRLLKIALYQVKKSGMRKSFLFISKCSLAKFPLLRMCHLRRSLQVQNLNTYLELYPHFQQMYKLVGEFLVSFCGLKVPSTAHAQRSSKT